MDPLATPSPPGQAPGEANVLQTNDRFRYGRLVIFATLTKEISSGHRGLESPMDLQGRNDGSGPTVSPRVWLDVPSLTGILVLPFHLMIAVDRSRDVLLDLHAGGHPIAAREHDIKSLATILYFAQFGGSPMRRLYVLMGLATVMIGTGLVSGLVSDRNPTDYT